MWHLWLRQHLYLAMFLASMIEGLGLPFPAEFLFVLGAVAIHRGDATFAGVVLATTFGNITGSMIGYSLAYAGGPLLIRRVAGVIRIKEESIAKVEQFFVKYGTSTVFISRFVGVIRAATIYTAGAARMSPVRFVVFLAAGALLWNAGWAFLAVQFGKRLPWMLHRIVSQGLVGLVTVVAIILIGVLVVRWLRKKPSGN
jgi:membrane protein DedA with SNARE-associated domain